MANPNDAINTDNGQFVFGLWSAKINGSYDAPWGLRVTPALRLQSGQPYARTFQVTMNYGSQRFLAEPFGSRQQDNIILVDTRVEKVFKLAKGTTLSAFVDGYNLTTPTPPRTSTGVRRANFTAADDDHPAAAVPLRREVRLVARNGAAGTEVAPRFRAAVSVPPGSVSRPRRSSSNRRQPPPRRSRRRSSRSA